MTQLPLVVEACPEISFEVSGKPLCQGSKVARVTGQRRREGRDTWVKNPMVTMIESMNMTTKSRKSGALRRWRDLLSYAASVQMGVSDVMLGAVEVEAEFIFPRSPSHFNKKGLRKGAPTIPQEDLDKLQRALGDALSGRVCKDDSQIIKWLSSKRFAATLDAVGGCKVRVRKL